MCRSASASSVPANGALLARKGSASEGSGGWWCENQVSLEVPATTPAKICRPRSLVVAVVMASAARSPAKLTLALMQGGAPNAEVLAATTLPELLDIAARHSIPLPAEFQEAPTPVAPLNIAPTVSTEG